MVSSPHYRRTARRCQASGSPCLASCCAGTRQVAVAPYYLLDSCASGSVLPRGSPVRAELAFAVAVRATTFPSHDVAPEMPGIVAAWYVATMPARTSMRSTPLAALSPTPRNCGLITFRELLFAHHWLLKGPYPKGKFNHQWYANNNSLLLKAKFLILIM